jgi:hypothetical protein
MMNLQTTNGKYNSVDRLLHMKRFAKYVLYELQVTELSPEEWQLHGSIREFQQFNMYKYEALDKDEIVGKLSATTTRPFPTLGTNSSKPNLVQDFQ